MKITVKEYDALAAVRRSDLEALRRSPAHMRHRQKHPQSSEAMSFGTALHAAILEPKAFDIGYAVAPICDKRTKAGKELWAEFEASNAGKAILRQEDGDTIAAMTDAIHAHPAASAILGRVTDIEETALWEDSGLKCKARFDAIAQDLGAVIDLKTTQDASPETFSRSIVTYGYHRQAAFYLMGARAAGIEVSSFIIIAVEKEAPWGVAVYRLDDAAIAQGQSEIMRLMEQYRECWQTDHWPCYPDEIVDITIPKWGFKDLDSTKTDIIF